MDLGIAGKVSLVIGGSQGIGLAVVRALANEGSAVGLVARGREKVDEVVRELTKEGHVVQGHYADMTDIFSYDRVLNEMLDGIGAPDIVVFSPPNPGPGGFFDLTERDFEGGFHNLVTCFGHLVRLVTPHMKDRGWGRIVTIGSGSTKEPQLGNRGFHYSIANVNRMAALRLSKQVSVEVAPFGITVNTIATGIIDTGLFSDWFSDRARENSVSPDTFIQQLIRSVPAKRLGTPEEMAALCLFLCSKQAGYTTGENILCDGGMMNTPM